MNLKLLSVAKGETPADLVIRNGKIVNVYSGEIYEGGVAAETLQAYEHAVKNGGITEKEARLFQFVLSSYGTGEFSTKRLEKDFGDAAYATVRGFVLKFERLGLLSSVRYGARVKYKIMR